jgi:Flp pilus assembly protein TadD
MQFSASCCAGKLEEAIEHLTEAISLNPTSAIMYATRGTLSLFFFL